MTPAKPQQMSGPKDDADDLIAELTKLMAVDAKTGSSVAPASTVPTIRIPGQPAPSNAAPIRIPGGSPGQGNSDAAPVARPIPVIPAAPPATPSSWQDRLGGRSAPAADPLAAFDAASAPRTGRIEPSAASSAWRPAIAPNDAAAAPALRNANFDFDFGFNRERPEPQRQATSPLPAKPQQPQPQQQVARVAPQPSWTAPVASAPPAPVNDPIADLIAAELSAEMEGRNDPSPAVPTSIPAAPQTPVYAQPAATVSYTPPQPTARPQQPAAEQASVRNATYTPRPTPETDAFSTAPVFGLGGRSSPENAPPKPRPDPMDEIENLIGEAVRVELNMPAPQPHRYDAPHPQSRAPQPAVPPLNGQFSPRRTTSLRDAEMVPSSADEVIAAASAGGAEFGRVDTPYNDQRRGRAARPKKTARRDQRDDVARSGGGAFKTLVVPAIAGLLLVVAGFGLYYKFGMSHGDGQPPVLTVDASVPVKTVPDKPSTTDAQHSVVMDQLGGAAPAPTTETLVSRDQSTGADATPPPVTPTTTAATANNSDSGLANRKVRTVTVRPDGTIVSNDDSVAGAEKLPVDRPNVPAVPGVSVAPPDDASAGASTNAAAAAPNAAVVAPPVAVAPVIAAAPAGDVTTDGGTATATNAPVPLPPPTRKGAAPQTVGVNAIPVTVATRPSSPVNAVVKPAASGNKPMDLIGNLAAQSAPAPVESANTPAASNAVSSAAGHVQLSSQTSQTGAQNSAATLQKRYASALNGAKLEVVKVDLGAKGIYYRVMLPTGSADEAVQVCTAIKSNGGDCVANR